MLDFFILWFIRPFAELLAYGCILAAVVVVYYLYDLFKSGD